MNYSYIPQKTIEKQPIYCNNCSICNSNNTYPLMNMIGSHRHCNNCKGTFKPQISGYKEVIVEKNSF